MVEAEVLVRGRLARAALLTNPVDTDPVVLATLKADVVVCVVVVEAVVLVVIVVIVADAFVAIEVDVVVSAAEVALLKAPVELQLLVAMRSQLHPEETRSQLLAATRSPNPAAASGRARSGLCR